MSESEIIMVKSLYMNLDGNTVKVIYSAPEGAVLPHSVTIERAEIDGEPVELSDAQEVEAKGLIMKNSFAGEMV